MAALHQHHPPSGEFLEGGKKKNFFSFSFFPPRVQSESFPNTKKSLSSPKSICFGCSTFPSTAKKKKIKKKQQKGKEAHKAARWCKRSQTCRWNSCRNEQKDKRRASSLADRHSGGGIVGNVPPLAAAEGSQSERGSFTQLLTAATLLHSGVAPPDNTPT